jgi:hypothetical protein
MVLDPLTIRISVRKLDLIDLTNRGGKDSKIRMCIDMQTPMTSVIFTFY